MAELVRVVEELEAQGHRITASRLAVLAAAAGGEDRFSADGIQQQLPHVGRATVFRTLKLLLEASVICRVLLDDGRMVYRWSRRGHHHHLVCRTCGAVSDLSGCGVEELLQSAVAARGYEMDGHWLEVYGRCAACAGGTDERRGEQAQR